MNFKKKLEKRLVELRDEHKNAVTQGQQWQRREIELFGAILELGMFLKRIDPKEITNAKQD